jgi:hypothetical protein
MTELTPREILDAIRRGLEETARRLSQGKLPQTQGSVQPPRPSEAVTDQDSYKDQRNT